MFTFNMHFKLVTTVAGDGVDILLLGYTENVEFTCARYDNFRKWWEDQ